ncbi:MAG: AAA family ATPase [Roseiarcus sp.]|jgi:uncharacterized protein YhaN
MKFERLILERFGMFQDAVLDFGDGGGLHVIYGANEAGKSTALAAISDLLFGIDERTPFNFRFEYGKLRIGAQLVKSTGERLVFKRRKARAGTLVSLSLPETTLPDAILTPFLGGIDRDRFHFMFGLDQGRLRSGGKQMLDPNGNFGHALFAAGTGLQSVSAVLAELEEEIRRLGSLADRRSKGEIWSAIDRFTGAVAAKKSDMIVPEAYHAAETARDKAVEERIAVDDQLTQLRARRNFLERGRRVAPILTALATLRREVAQYGDTPDLPENFVDDWKTADDDVRSAAQAVNKNVAEAKELTEKVSATPAIDPIIGFEATIDALCERLGKYLGDADDLPKLARRIAELNDQIRLVMRDLGLDHDPDEVESVLPTKVTFAKIRDLINQGAVVRSTLETAATNHDVAKAALAAAGSALTSLPPDVDVSEPTRLLDQAAKLGDVTNALAAAKGEAEAADKALSEALGRLGLWSGAVDELASLPVPDATALSQRDGSLLAAKQHIVSVEKALQETKRDALQVEAELAGLAAAGEVPSPGAIREARDERDGNWRRIRSRLNPQPVLAAGPATEVSDPNLIGAFETNVRHADELVDRREAEAQRVAQLTALTAKQKSLAATIDELGAQRDAANAKLQELESEWLKLWDGTKVTVKSPPEMGLWLNRRTEALRLRGEATKAAGMLRAAHAAADKAHTLLEAAAKLIGLEQPAQDFAELDRQLRQTLSTLQASAKERLAATTRLTTAGEAFQKTKGAFERATAAEAKWLTDWKAAVSEIHIAPTAGTKEAEAALEAWEAVATPLTKRREDQRRHKGLNQDLEHFRTDVLAVAADLGEAAPAGAPIEKTVRTLKTRLDAAKEAAQARGNLQGRIDAVQTSLGVAENQRREAEFVIDGLKRKYGFDGSVDPFELARRSSQRRSLVTQLNERVKELAKAGDGLDEPTLQAEVDSVPPDQANAELPAIQANEAPLIAKLQLLASAVTEAEHALTALGGKKGAAVADQEARNAALAAGGHIERWLRLEVARQLLERSVQRFQDTNQDPMITRASELFARIAKTAANPIERVSINYRNAAKPVPIGRRHDGSECGLEGLSEATSDQLFLSLRVAAIERFCQDNEPMPFIADDLFVSSDEHRVLPLMEILAELGQTTQVVAFTHHQHVAEIAAKLPAASVQIHTMPATS